MEKTLSILLSLILLMCSLDNYAFESSDIEAASYDCTDETAVIGIAGEPGMSSQLLIFKNGKQIYFNEDFEDIQHIWSIYCFKQVIILTGIHGSYFATAAITTNKDKVNLQFIGASRRLPDIDVHKDEIIVSLFGDDREDQSETIVKHISFTKPFILPHATNKLASDPFPAIRLFHAPHLKNHLTTLATCYSKEKKAEYTLLAYTDENKKNHLTLLDSMTIHRIQKDEYVSEIPFLATNSQCFEDATYLFGISEKRNQRARFYFDANGKPQIELIDVSNLPF